MAIERNGESIHRLAGIIDLILFLGVMVVKRFYLQVRLDALGDSADGVHVAGF
ncbi:MAG: hypothetical protein IIA01_01690 [Proteobacteria bacterium]|nr:hypothetical protein [Pseudomonadota bacterium]